MSAAADMRSPCNLKHIAWPAGMHMRVDVFERSSVHWNDGRSQRFLRTILLRRERRSRACHVDCKPNAIRNANRADRH